MRTVNLGNLSEQLTRVLVNDHQPGLAGDEEPVVRWIRDDVIPPALSPEHVSVRQVEGGRGLGGKHHGHDHGEDECAKPHRNSWSQLNSYGAARAVTRCRNRAYEPVLKI